MPEETKQDHVQRLVDIMERLRAPDGCPWDREQTHHTLRNYIVEETGELLDAIEEEDDESIVDELGDVLLQVVFHAQIAAEANRFTFQDVARRCAEKLIRRHPHVFADAEVEDAAGVVEQWDKIKKTEAASEKRTSALDGVARHVPALQRAQKIQRRAAKVGFDWPSVDGVVDKIHEELEELKEALAEGNRSDVAEELGDVLFSVVNLARFKDHDAEQLLHDTTRKFITRFRGIEDILDEQGRKPEQCTLQELDDLWNLVKSHAAAQK